MCSFNSQAAGPLFIVERQRLKHGYTLHWMYFLAGVDGEVKDTIRCWLNENCSCWLKKTLPFL